MLQVNNAVVRYGSITALHGISLEVKKGEIVTLLGANGAGKTTTLRMLSGLLSAQEGEILFEGNDITKTKPHKFTGLGISHVPEGRRIFPQMTVEENLDMGAFSRLDSYDEDIEKMFTMFPILKDRRKQLGGNLSGGEQQMLAIARSLMTNPEILLLDEPMEGLAPVIVEMLLTVLRKLITEEALTVILVEQSMKLALGVTQEVMVLNRGMVSHQGLSEDLLRDDELLAQLVIAH